jgi:aconitate hydratase
MLIPQVVGFKLSGTMREGTTATDLVLTVTEMLRTHGVVGKFVEFFGDGLNHLPLADRATLGNMSPEFGSTCAIFPIDDETLRYLTLSGRDPQHIEVIEAYAREQGMWREQGQPDALYSDLLELDMGTVEPSLAGPKRPQDRIALSQADSTFRGHLKKTVENRDGGGSEQVTIDGQEVAIKDGAVLIAAITSCTNTSNPAVMLAAGLLARNARAKGL